MREENPQEDIHLSRIYDKAVRANMDDPQDNSYDSELLRHNP